MLFKRREFLKSSLGAAFAASMPIFALAEPAKGEQMPDGLAVQMGVIVNGPFLSFRHKFRADADVTSEIRDFVNFVRVKIKDKEFDFDQHDLIGNLYNAEEFMRRLGYKVWICTDEVKKFKRPIDDKKYRVNAKKFGDALDLYRKNNS